jgi:hypothetical protein
MKFHELDLTPGQKPIDVRNKDAPRTGVTHEMWLEPRSLLVMQGDARYKWQHEIPNNKRSRGSSFRRVSVTYRTKRKANQPAD